MSDQPRNLESAELEYLCVDDFLRDFLHSQALATALSMGLVDRMLQGVTITSKDVAGESGGRRLLFDLLRASGVVEERDGAYHLTVHFRQALRYRELMEAKLESARLAAADFLQNFGALVEDPGRFMAHAAMFRLFDYGRACAITPENVAFTQCWMRLTTSLTRHEAGVLLARYPFSQYRRLLDIGGNSGEFACQACAAHPHMEATVFDLPVVCEVGRTHVAGRPGGDRVRFNVGDARRDELPLGHDVIVFKSMLHDWPEGDAVHFIRRASEVLSENGSIVIFERDLIDVGNTPLPYGALPLVAFASSYRGPDLYVNVLRELGFGEIKVERIQLELPFFLLSARRNPVEMSQVRWTM